MSNGYAEGLIAELKRQGVDEYHIEMGGAHPRLVFSFNSRQQFFVFPGTPGGDEERGIENAVSNLRHLMGVKRVPQRKSKREKHRRPRTAPIGLVPSLDSFSRPDPLAALKAWKPPSRFVWQRSGPRSWLVTMRA